MRPRVHGRGIFLLALLPLIPALLVLVPFLRRGVSTTVPLSTVLHLAAHRDIARAVIAADGSVQITTRRGRAMSTQKEPGELLTPTLMQDGAQVSVTNNATIGWGSIVDGTLVLIVVGALLAFSRREMRQGRWPASSPGLAVEPVSATSVMFTDVAGVDEAKAELAEVVAFLSAPARFRILGARIPRGVLLSGPPGTGKTLLARAVAGEAHVPFFSISGSAFVEMYVGVGASRVRTIFARARKCAPCIVFIDELDAIGGRRGGGHGGSNEEREHTLNQLLVEMDGFGGDTGVVVIAATNRPDMLDAALLRPGRFDRRVTISAPDRAGRKAVLTLHAMRLRLEGNVDLDALAGQTSGMTPADLANLLNEAALLAARTQQPAVGWTHLDAAFLRLLAGPELRSRILPPSLKRVISYHEAGHALVMKLLPHCDPVAKVQAIARGNALGITVSRPAEDQYLLTKEALLERLAGLMGGRAAEAIIFGEVTTGAQQDIQQANALARRMVAEFGMSRLGHICVGDDGVLSPELAWQIDQVTRELVEAAYAQAQRILESIRPTLIAVAERLCAVETIDGDELDTWLQHEPVPDPAIRRDTSILGGANAVTE